VGCRSLCPKQDSPAVPRTPTTPCQPLNAQRNKYRIRFRAVWRVITNQVTNNKQPTCTSRQKMSVGVIVVITIPEHSTNYHG
jgi:hypothetical protein